MASHSAQTVDKPTHRKNAEKSKPAQTKNPINKRISHSRKKRLCESIFAYCVNRPSTYLCTPVGAVFLSACVSQRLQRVEKYFFDTLGGMWLHIPLCYTDFLICYAKQHRKTAIVSIYLFRLLKKRV